MLDARRFRQIMGCFATGIAVLTTRDSKGNAVGLTVNSLTSVSLDPALVLVCIDRKAHVFPIFRKAEKFGFSFLAEGQEAVSRHFASHHNPKPPKVWASPQEGCPIVRQSLGWIVCRRHAVYNGGDHIILVGEVIKAHKKAGHHDPLLYFHGRYRDIKN